MKKRIAVFSSGWGDEYFREIVFGISEAAKKENIDTFAFVNFSIRGLENLLNECEFNLFTLPDLRDFSGVILMANSFNLPKEVTYFSEQLKNLGIPAVSIEYKMDGMPSLVSDNYDGMYDLVKHVVEHHGARNILYIGGPETHLENKDRLKALQDVAKEHGFRVPEENIKYGDWAKNSAMELAAEWVNEHNGLPDAILCANDVMAMGVCEQLERMNYSVPGNVIVTGYDCLKAGREYRPSISSVGHAWERMGEQALRMLLKCMNGEAQDDVVLPTCFIPGRSCGCSNAMTAEHNTYLDIRSRGKEIGGLEADAHFRHFYLALQKADNAEDLSDGLSELFEKEHEMEGEDFMLCLDPEFFRIEEDDLNLFVQGYSEKVMVIGSIRNGKAQPRVLKERNEALFWISKEKKEPGLYICVPILSDLRTYGFAIMTGDLCVACDNQFYIWTRHMSQDLEQVRRNITISDLTRKLTQLSVTDVLTGVYNRAGCEEIAYPILEEWRARGGNGVIMLVDIDKMKWINDIHGHANGDLALRTVAAVLKSGLPEDFIVSRFGGDEFFVGGRLRGPNMNLKELRESLEINLLTEIKKRGIDFPLTISIGSVIISPEKELDIEKYLQLADEDMYEIKSAHHKQMEILYGIKEAE